MILILVPLSITIIGIFIKVFFDKDEPWWF